MLDGRVQQQPVREDGFGCGILNLTGGGGGGGRCDPQKHLVSHYVILDAEIATLPLGTCRTLFMR